jgi:putative methionine-R-sulfoxide reductase with GAF domain
MVVDAQEHHINRKKASRSIATGSSSCQEIALDNVVAQKTLANNSKTHHIQDTIHANNISCSSKSYS